MDMTYFALLSFERARAETPAATRQGRRFDWLRATAWGGITFLAAAVWVGLAMLVL